MGEIAQRFRLATAIIDQDELRGRIALGMFRQRRDAAAKQIAAVARGNDHTHQWWRIWKGPMNQMAARWMMGNRHLAAAASKKSLQTMGRLTR